MKHPRNPHQDQYPLDKLVQSYPALKTYLVTKVDGKQSINFADPKAVKALNAALLAHYYQIPFWDIPAGYLCPPVPGRADYVHYIADLLAGNTQDKLPKGKKIKGLDIGTGANLIYPILANRSYGWTMLGTDIDPVSIKSAQHVIKANPKLCEQVSVRHQPQANSIFAGVIKQNEYFDFCMCNPPFHSSAKQAQMGSERKMTNLAKNQTKRGKQQVAQSQAKALNFAGQANELWCQGGELKFIQLMIQESVDFSEQIGWFTSLVSKKDNLPKIYQSLKQHGITDIKTVNMAQGQKVSRFVAWRF